MSDPSLLPAQPASGFVRIFGAVLRFVRQQGTQASTYRGIVMILTAAGVVLRPEMIAAITAVGMAGSGLIAVLFPDQAPGVE